MTDDVVTVVWSDRYGLWVDYNGGYTVNYYPTHWMPMPEPPKTNTP